jgi:hypothetical protein
MALSRRTRLRLPAHPAAAGQPLELVELRRAADRYPFRPELFELDWADAGGQVRHRHTRHAQRRRGLRSATMLAAAALVDMAAFGAGVGEETAALSLRGLQDGQARAHIVEAVDRGLVGGAQFAVAGMSAVPGRPEDRRYRGRAATEGSDNDSLKPIYFSTREWTGVNWINKFCGPFTHIRPKLFCLHPPRVLPCNRHCHGNRLWSAVRGRARLAG